MESRTSNEKWRDLEYFLSCVCFALIWLKKNTPQFFLKLILEEIERETLMWAKNINLLPPTHTLHWDWTHSLGMRPDQKLNPLSFWCVGQCFNQLSHSRKGLFGSLLIIFFMIGTYIGLRPFLFPNVSI